MNSRQITGFVLILIGILLTVTKLDVSIPGFGSLYLNVLSIVIGVRFAFVGYRQRLWRRISDENCCRASL